MRPSDATTCDHGVLFVSILWSHILGDHASMATNQRTAAPGTQRKFTWGGRIVNITRITCNHDYTRASNLLCWRWGSGVGIVMSLKESFRLLILKYRDKIQRLNGSCARKVWFEIDSCFVPRRRDRADTKILTSASWFDGARSHKGQKKSEQPNFSKPLFPPTTKTHTQHTTSHKNQEPRSKTRTSNSKNNDAKHHTQLAFHRLSPWYQLFFFQHVSNSW